MFFFTFLLSPNQRNALSSADAILGTVRLAHCIIIIVIIIVVIIVRVSQDRKFCIFIVGGRTASYRPVDFLLRVRFPHIS